MRKTRLYYSRETKRKILLNIMQGRKFEDILSSLGYNINSALEKDKKYCSKLLHKWRDEVYKNEELLYFINTEISSQDIQNEIKSLKDDEENDDIMTEVKNKKAQNEKRFEIIKTRITAKKNKN